MHQVEAVGWQTSDFTLVNTKVLDHKKGEGKGMKNGRKPHYTEHDELTHSASSHSFSHSQ